MAGLGSGQLAAGVQVTTEAAPRWTAGAGRTREAKLSSVDSGALGIRKPVMPSSDDSLRLGSESLRRREAATLGPWPAATPGCWTAMTLGH